MTAINKYIDSQDWDTAIADCTIAIRGNPKNHGAYMNRGYARCFVPAKDENYEKAIEDFSVAIALASLQSLSDQELAEYYVKRAYAYWLNGNYDRAAADCKQDIIEKAGEEKVKVFAHELLGNIFSATNNPAAAVEEYKKVLDCKVFSASLLDKYRETVKRLNNT
jgi:tetratricopeptide (TPR) repeat protein